MVWKKPGVTCEFEFKKDYPALYNDPDFTSYVAETIKNAKIEDIKGEIRTATTIRRFCVLCLNCLVHLFIRVRQKMEIYPHHHPKFNISESSMLVAQKLWVLLFRLFKLKGE